MATAATPQPSPEALEAEARRAAHVARARQSAAATVRDRLRLPPKLTLSEWADRYRMISPPAAEHGQWRTDRVPFIREIADTISGREYNDVTIVKGSQTAGTEGCINNAVGYYIDQEPSALLVIQPNVKPMAEGWSKERLAPMLRDSPRLRGKVKDPRSRDSGNTVLQKSFPGGFLVVVGANSPAGLASWPIRCVFADELDRWPASAGTEGDPLSLAEARQITYRHRKKTVKVSTPGNEGESRIEKEWRKSDQRHYYVPCPHCGHAQPLEWRDSGGKPDIVAGKGPYRLVWDKTVDEATGNTVHHTDTAQYVCRACACTIDESHKPAMVAAGRWVTHNPTSRRAGFHISGLLSPWVRWKDIAAKWIAVKDDDEQRKTFVNTLLGLLYAVEGDVPDADALAKRREAYPEPPAEVPEGVGVLTAAIDVQGGDGRLEVKVMGWGAGEESWMIRLERLHGDSDSAEVWERAEAILTRPWRHASGAELRIRAVMVDSGFNKDAVYKFVKPRQGRGVYAYKGVDGAKAPISRATRANRDGVKVFNVDPVAFKDTLFGRLKRKAPGPGYLHFGPEDRTGADANYFAQFGAEKRQVEYRDNRPKVVYKQIAKRNEAIDLYVMNLAALRSLGLTTAQHLGAMAERVTAEGRAKAAEASAAPQHPAPPARQAAPRRGGWVNKWRG